MTEFGALPNTRVGYWISPNNCFFVVEQHIFSVCDYPHVFGTSEAVLRKVFESHQEPWRSELKAREAIIIALVRAGWIRLRNYSVKPGDYWAGNMPDLEAHTIARVCAFMRRTHARERYADVRMTSPDSRYVSTVDQMMRPDPPPCDSPIPKLAFVVSPAEIPMAGLPRVDLTACIKT